MICWIFRIESGNLNLKSEQMSRKTFGTAINTTIGPLMEQKNITFQCDLQHMEEMIYTDAVRFKQIFFNLLSNAAKYTPEGGNVWLLTERLRTEGNVEWVRFTVRDSGIGMSEEFLEHAFEPFSQEGNRTLALQWQGTGLGLAIVKKLVVMMHGTIEIHSKLGGYGGNPRSAACDLGRRCSGKMPQAVMAKTRTWKADGCFWQRTMRSILLWPDVFWNQRELLWNMRKMEKERWKWWSRIRRDILTQS